MKFTDDALIIQHAVSTANWATVYGLAIFWIHFKMSEGRPFDVNPGLRA